MQPENQLNPINFNDQSLNLREEIEKYAYHWKWFVVAIVVALIAAFVYLRYTPNIYQVSSTILVVGDSDSTLPSELSAFEDLGFGKSSSSFDDEIELLKSRSLMTRVVKELGINVTYFKKGRIVTSELFLNQVPVKINFFTKDSIFYNRDTSFVVQVKSETNFTLISQ